MAFISFPSENIADTSAMRIQIFQIDAHNVTRVLSFTTNPPKMAEFGKLADYSDFVGYLQ
jgi:hypothetical protein